MRRGVEREDWVGMCWGVVFVFPFGWNEKEEGREAGEFEEEGVDPSQTRKHEIPWHAVANRVSCLHRRLDDALARAGLGLWVHVHVCAGVADTAAEAAVCGEHGRVPVV